MTIKAIENKKRKTGYADICTAVLQRICSGEWPVNRRIPSESELIAMFGVSKVTAARAMQELARAGVITRVHGVGSFVASSVLTRTSLRPSIDDAPAKWAQAAAMRWVSYGKLIGEISRLMGKHPGLVRDKLDKALAVLLAAAVNEAVDHRGKNQD